MSNASVQDAIQYIERLANLYKPLIDVRDLLTEIGSLQAQIPELNARKMTLIDEIETFTKEKDAIKVTKQSEIEDLVQEVILLNINANHLEVSTNEKIQGMLNKAEVDATLAAQAIRDSKLNELTALDDQITGTRATLVQIEQDVTTMTQEAQRVSTETAAAQAGLAEVVRTIEQLSKFGTVPSAPEGVVQ